MPVELVFVHGWGFDARFWDGLCARLPQFRQSRIELGFFGAAPAITENHGSPQRILVGHSLGFVHGLRQRQDWSGWIAINGFARFVQTSSQAGCVPAARLREMCRRLQNDTAGTLQDFYQLIGAVPFAATPNRERLGEGLDELRDGDVSGIVAALDSPGLALAGRGDPLVPLAASAALGGMAKRGGLRLHDKAGHLLPQTDPGWCAGAIADFVTTSCG